MKKIVLAVLAVMCVTSFSFAGNFGLGVKVGAGENNWKPGLMATDVEKGYGFAAVEALYEFDTLNEYDKIGLKVGAELYQKDKASNAFSDVQTYDIPVTLYYKRDNGIKALSYYAGGGFTYINSRVKSIGYTKSKGTGHIMAGIEYRFTKTFALGADAIYNLHAALQAGDVSDRTGFRGALVGRFYF